MFASGVKGSSTSRDGAATGRLLKLVVVDWIGGRGFVRLVSRGTTNKDLPLTIPTTFPPLDSPGFLNSLDFFIDTTSYIRIARFLTCRLNRQKLGQ